MNKVEVEARYEIELEEYIKKFQIESRVMGDLAQNHIIPASFRYQNFMAGCVNKLQNCGLKKDTYGTQLKLIRDISNHITQIQTGVDRTFHAYPPGRDRQRACYTWLGRSPTPMTGAKERACQTRGGEQAAATPDRINGDRLPWPRSPT